ncbi:two-component regulator propeller domain-containing protein [Hymenobacter ginsengisoli]|uniref:Two-component regulator propeller domain-containing protein n=1 Tax=Hymenobacter ginsengisoli TaxID=1051626 RepID=A0ABP8QT65_9BACT
MALLAAGRARGQAAYGDWQLHLPARHPLCLADAGSRLYVADESSFYFYDKSLHTTQMLSRRDGFNDVGVATLAYDSASAKLVVAYSNGNLDVVGASGAVRNVADVVRKAGQTAKGVVRQVQIYNGLAYVSTTLGLVVLDLAKLEVRDTYSAIGAGGAVVSAYAAAVVHDTIYAATSAGILRGRISSAVNLLDYRSWTAEVPNAGLPTQVYTQLVVYRGHVVAGADARGLDYLAGVGAARAWRFASTTYADEMRRLRVSAGQLLVAQTNTPLRRFDAKTGVVVNVIPVSATGNIINDAVAQADGTYYVASYDKGLLRFASANAPPELIRPNAPEQALDYSLLADASTNTVDVFSGGYGGDNAVQQGSRNGFYEYKDRQWTNYTASNYPSPSDFPNLLDMSRGTRTPDGTLYIASYGEGLLEWKGPGQFRRFTQGTPGSPLRSSLATSDPNYPFFVRVTDVAADPNSGRVWVVNRHPEFPGAPGLFRFRPANNTWFSVPAFTGFENLDRVTVDNFGNPWATQSRKGGQGLVAFDTLSQKPFYFNTSTGLPSNLLYDIVCDRNGDIWVGTAAGVAVYNDPSQLLSAAASGTSQGVFRLPLVTRGVGTGFNALYNETVRCIAIDGANRKWLGTPNGLWLFSADCTEALLNFTTANSPLPSNSVVDVAVNDKTGEVFVATDAGLVSYRGSASVTDGTPGCAQVSPNPVRPEFAGTVGISGVANNAQVRITDVAGHLVYSTHAAGGTVTWNLTDTAGRRVRSGIYLVLTADAEGKNTCVSKVAVLSN